MSMVLLFSRTSWPYILGILLIAAGLLFFILPHEDAEIPEQSLRETPVVSAINRIMPSVVNISTHGIVQRISPIENNLFSQDDEPGTAQNSNPETYSLGSGSIIHESGLILTNAHVVHRASAIDVTLNNGQMYKAIMIANDYLNDIALLKIISPPENLVPLRPARVNDLMLGETVIAVGNPFGLDSSVTVGILSGINRKFTYNGKVLFSDMIQTDVSVYHGNSGGPLLNLDAEIIGMNMSYFRGAPRIGFAIPLMRIENVLARWIIPEKMSSLSFGLVPQVRINSKQRPEIYISEVFEDSPAAKAGIHEGDILTVFNGNTCHSLSALSREMMNLKAGQPVTLKTGNGKEFRIEPEQLHYPDGLELAKEKLNISLQILTPQLSELLQIPPLYSHGIIVNDIAGLGDLPIKRGDILVNLNSYAINSPEDIAHVLNNARPGERIDAGFISNFQDKASNKLILEKYWVAFLTN